ncbi:hypothetical protein [Agrobacterium genomosp. 2]|uniref:Uncharacterized protein n=1 Tax=Agrobacterium genomosp. 2 str. CFBP 5494 TaxID=1183436 RepID=A0A9W5AZ04_9HYPH|nr:hypothetical protein [Agrobacterium genomosp. 2]CUW87538.1 hypothetical protein AGR2A_Cc120089 [Agrobacterium genomosp. 2 str. CFBP 5494]
MPAADVDIDRFPSWSTRARRPAAPRVDWVSLGSEYDIAHVVRLWQLVMRFRIESLPDDESVMWQLADGLRGRRGDAVRIREGIVSIDRRHLKEFRDAIDWLWDHLADEHGDQRYAWCRDVGQWLRMPTEQPPITNLEDARRAVEIIDDLMDVAADNVIKLWEDA